MIDRIYLAKNLLNLKSGFFVTAIDDVEQKLLSYLLELIFGEIVGTVVVRVKPSGRPIPNGFAIAHEYLIFARVNQNYPVARFPHTKEQRARYKEVDEKGPFFWELLRKAGSNSTRSARPTMYFPFFVDTNTLAIRLPRMHYDEKISRVYPG